MSDQHRFTRELMWLRRKHPALRGGRAQRFHVHNENRVIAFQRWVPDAGRDVVVVASLNETTFRDQSYRIGFPVGGHWHEVFNSDVYDNWFNPNAQGNYGGVTADGRLGWIANLCEYHAAGEQPSGVCPRSGRLSIPGSTIMRIALRSYFQGIASMARRPAMFIAPASARRRRTSGRRNCRT